MLVHTLIFGPVIFRINAIYIDLSIELEVGYFLEVIHCHILFV